MGKYNETGHTDGPEWRGDYTAAAYVIKIYDFDGSGFNFEAYKLDTPARTVAGGYATVNPHNELMAEYGQMSFLLHEDYAALDIFTPEDHDLSGLGGYYEKNEFDLPVSEVPELYPDILGIRGVEYGEMPTFATINEASAYVLHNVLNDNYEMEFYLDKELVPDEGSGYVLFCAFENAQSYFPFGAYDIYDAYTKDCGDPQKVFARLKLVYSGDKESDMEARAEALEFVMKNPIPHGGFADFKDEKAYALKIHDFIAKKVTYSPIGYNIMAALSEDSYKMKQEAYNVLGESEEDAVCAAYARSFAMICHYAGINAAWVRGNENNGESHAWNIVFPCDGSTPVLADVTWDDTDSGDDRVGQEIISYSYFYLPVEEDYQHTPIDFMEAFILYINGQ